MRTSIVALAALVATSAFSSAVAQSCERLWVERNSIYKDRGYCFKTPRAIAYFGNRGCVYEYEGAIPFSRAERARLAEIVAMERDFGCR